MENIIKINHIGGKTMFKITCSANERNEIKEMFLTELAVMHIHGASLPENRETIEAAKELIQNNEAFMLELVCDGVFTEMQTSDDVALYLVEELQGENSYCDEYQGCEIEEIANKIVAKFPSAIVEGEFEYQGNGYFDVVTVATINGQVVVEHSEADGEFDFFEDDEEDCEEERPSGIIEFLCSEKETVILCVIEEIAKMCAISCCVDYEKFGDQIKAFAEKEIFVIDEKDNGFTLNIYNIGWIFSDLSKQITKSETNEFDKTKEASFRYVFESVFKKYPNIVINGYMNYIRMGDKGCEVCNECYRIFDGKFICEDGIACTCCETVVLQNEAFWIDDSNPYITFSLCCKECAQKTIEDPSGDFDQKMLDSIQEKLNN